MSARPTRLVWPPLRPNPSSRRRVGRCRLILYDLDDIVAATVIKAIKICT